MLYPKIYAAVFAIVTLIHIVVFNIVLKDVKPKEVVASAAKKAQNKEFTIQTVKIKLKPKVEEFVQLAKTEVKREIKKPIKKIKKVAKKKVVKKVEKKVTKKVTKQKPKEIEKPVEDAKVVENAKVEDKIEKQKDTKSEEDNKDKEAVAKINKEMYRYLRRLQYEMEKRKIYPPDSKKQKHEGTVMLSFVIQKNGKITNMNVIRGCLHPKLNEAALKILKELGSFEPIPDKFKKKTWAIQVPIKYKIVNEF